MTGNGKNPAEAADVQLVVDIRITFDSTGGIMIYGLPENEMLFDYVIKRAKKIADGHFEKEPSRIIKPT